MNLTESVKTCFSKYAIFKGRASRSEYWWFTLVDVLVECVFTQLYNFFPTIVLLDYLGIIAWIVFLLPCISVAARRLHDVNKSGWWQFLGLMPTFVLLILGSLATDITEAFEGATMLVLVAATIIAIIVYIRWMILKGTDGDNRFGSNPLKDND